MLRKIRLVLALFFWVAITLLFLDFTGTVHSWFGWMAKIQFVPAILALNVGVVIGLVVLTLVLGRVYCSVICPLGVMQDFFAWLGRRGKSVATSIPILRLSLGCDMVCLGCLSSLLWQVCRLYILS